MGADQLDPHRKRLIVSARVASQPWRPSRSAASARPIGITNSPGSFIPLSMPQIALTHAQSIFTVAAGPLRTLNNQYALP